MEHMQTRFCWCLLHTEVVPGVLCLQLHMNPKLGPTTSASLFSSLVATCCGSWNFKKLKRWRRTGLTWHKQTVLRFKQQKQNSKICQQYLNRCRSDSPSWHGGAWTLAGCFEHERSF